MRVGRMGEGVGAGGGVKRRYQQIPQVCTVCLRVASMQGPPRDSSRKQSKRSQYQRMAQHRGVKVASARHPSRFQTATTVHLLPSEKNAGRQIVQRVSRKFFSFSAQNTQKYARSMLSLCLYKKKKTHRVVMC